MVLQYAIVQGVRSPMPLGREVRCALSGGASPAKSGRVEFGIFELSDLLTVVGGSRDSSRLMRVNLEVAEMCVRAPGRPVS